MQKEMEELRAACWVPTPTSLTQTCILTLFKEWYKTHNHLKTTDSKEHYFGMYLRDNGIPAYVIKKNEEFIFHYCNQYHPE